MTRAKTGKALTPEQNERVRRAVRGLVTKHGSQNKAAVVLDVHQASLSQLLDGQRGAGIGLATRVAEASGMTIAVLLQDARLGPTDTGPTLADVMARIDALTAEVAALRRAVIATATNLRTWAIPTSRIAGWATIRGERRCRRDPLRD